MRDLRTEAKNMRKLDRFSRPRRLALLMAAAGAASYVGQAQAATGRAWLPTTPGSYTWATETNWSGGLVPDTNAEIAAFGNVLTAGTWNLDVGSAITLGGITTSSASNTNVVLNLTGAKITLNDDLPAAAANFNFNYGNGSTLTVGNDVEFADAQGISSNFSRSVTFNGVLSGSANVTLTNSGGVTLINSGNTYSGTWALAGLTTLTTTSNATGSATFRLLSASGSSGNSTLKFSDTADFSSSNTITDSGAWSPNLTQGGGSGGVQVVGGVTSSFSNMEIGGTAGNGYVQLGRVSGTLNAVIKITDVDWSPNANVRLDNATLDLANTSGVQTFSGALAATGTASALTRSGAGGTTILTKASNLGGAVTVTGGTLLVNNGTTGRNDAAVAVNTTNGSRSITTASTAGLVVGQAITGAGISSTAFITSIIDGTSFTINATSTATASGVNATVKANSATGIGAVSVSGTGTKLGGSGQIVPGGSAGVTIGSGSILAPGGDASGDTLGVLTLNGANTSGALLTLQSGAVLEMQLGAGLASDKINLYGYAGQSDLVRNDNVIRLSGTGVTEGTYNLLNTYDAAGAAVATGFSGGLTVELSPALAQDFTASLDYSTLGQVNLKVVAVPEPTAAIALGAVAGGLLIQRRRRA